MHKECVVALEGIDGSGKSTLAQMLSKEFDVALYERTKKGYLLDCILSTMFMQKYRFLQIPIYLLLSYKNYLSFLIKKGGIQRIIMDRCFLSNICYFYPTALENLKLMKLLMRFEVKLLPNMIFILDENPEISWNRDKNKKSLHWIMETRNAYLSAEKSDLLSQYDIRIIEGHGTIEEKYMIIAKEIRRKMEW